MQSARNLRPALCNGPPLGGRQASPLGLPSSVRIDIEEPTEDRKIRLMEHKCRSFPEAIVQAVFQVMLRCPQHSSKQLGTGIVRDNFTRHRTIRRTGLTAQACPAFFCCDTQACTIIGAVVLCMSDTRRGWLRIDLFGGYRGNTAVV